jgi:tetratricopeptide (TPR) repeat protein
MMLQRNRYYIAGGRRSLLETVYNHRVVPAGNGLDMEHLVVILAEAIPEFCKDHDLVHMARSKARQLTMKYRRDNDDDDRYYNHHNQHHHDSRCYAEEDIEDVAMILEDFLGSTPSLPPCLVAYVHTYIGLVRQYEQRYSSAIVSLLKALWIRKSSHEEADQLAVSCHRLGLVHGLAGDFDQATNLLQRALDYYREAHIANEHEFVVGARRSLDVYEQKKSNSQELKDSSSSRTGMLSGTGHDLWQISESELELVTPEPS